MSPNLFSHESLDHFERKHYLFSQFSIGKRSTFDNRKESEHFNAFSPFFTYPIRLNSHSFIKSKAFLFICTIIRWLVYSSLTASIKLFLCIIISRSLSVFIHSAFFYLHKFQFIYERALLVYTQNQTSILIIILRNRKSGI